MNIFILDKDTIKCAEYHCDKHVVKMIVEYAQIMSTVNYKLGSWNDNMCKPTHENHPCVIWACDKIKNYEWLRSLWYHLLREYTKRYNKIHSYDSLKKELLNPPHSWLVNSRTEALGKFVQCMPDQYKNRNVVKAYRDYYIGEKITFCKI